MNTVGTGTGICTTKKSDIQHPSLSYRLQEISSLYMDSHNWSVGSGKSNCVYVLYSAENNSDWTAYDVTVQKGSLQGAEIIFTSIKFTITKPPNTNGFYIHIVAYYNYGATVIPDQNNSDILYLLFGDSNNVYKQYIYKCVISTQTSTLITSSIYDSSYFPGYGPGLMRMNAYDSYVTSITISGGSSPYVNGCVFDLNTGTQKYVNNDLNNAPIDSNSSSILPIYGTPYHLIQSSKSFGKFWIFDASNKSVTELNSPYKTAGEFRINSGGIPSSDTIAYGSNTNYHRQAYSREIKKDVYIVGQYGFMIYVDMTKKYAEVLNVRPEHMSTIMFTKDGKCYPEGTLDYIIDSGSVSSSYYMYMTGIGTNYPFIIYWTGSNNKPCGVYQMQIDATI